MDNKDIAELRSLLQKVKEEAEKLKASTAKGNNEQPTVRTTRQAAYGKPQGY